MLQSWCKILPFFIVEWLTKRTEVFTDWNHPEKRCYNAPFRYVRFYKAKEIE